MERIKIILIAGLFLILIAIFAGWYLIGLAPKPVSVTQKPEQKKFQQVWGAYTGNTAESFAAFQKQVGACPNINAVFPDWGTPFPIDLAGPVKANKQTIIIFWEPNITLDQIISGGADSYISSFATGAKNYGAPVILVPMEEMNGNWDAWNGTLPGNSPQKIIEAWRHMHDLFLGVANVKWGWDVNNVSVPDTQANAIENYYPGDAYVDYVGVDGFNFGNPWQSYSEIFSSALQKLKTYNKPIYIFSMACAEGPQKPAWIADAISQIKSDKSIAGWIWFNENKEQNWLIDSDQESLKVFISGIK